MEDKLCLQQMSRVWNTEWESLWGKCIKHIKEHWANEDNLYGRIIERWNGKMCDFLKG